MVAYTSQGKGNSEFKPVKLHLENDLVSHPAHAEGFGKYIHLWTNHTF